jgi:hypothetical protein
MTLRERNREREMGIERERMGREGERMGRERKRHEEKGIE